MIEKPHSDVEGTHLQISRLRDDPLVNELLRIFSETQEKFSIRFQRIYRFDGFVNFVVQALYFLLTSGG